LAAALRDHRAELAESTAIVVIFFTL